MNTWVQVDKLQNAEPVNSDTLNRPVDQLASRTEYLKKRLGTIMEDGVQSSLVLTDVTLLPDENDTMKVGNIVYRSTNGFKKAQAKMHLYDDFTAADAAFTIGILISVTGNIGDVLIYGKLGLGSTPIAKENILQSGDTFRPGRYYLSATESGKMTSDPNGPLIYLGSFFSSTAAAGDFTGDDVAYVNPQFLDIGTSHVHRAYTLVARPAGYLSGNDVIGYLPIGAVESSSDSESESSDPCAEYPTLLFSGTWTSVSDVNYTFTLSDSSAWGSVTLKWYKNGQSGSYHQVNIPAPGVFVDLDNGLKVKVQFPEATNTHAFGTLTEAERTWNLKFPYHGKGWVNHSVDAVADIVDADTARGESPSISDAESPTSSSSIEPELHAIFSGAWPSNDNSVYALIPKVAYEKAITEDTSTVTIGTVTYQFVAEGETPATGNVGVAKAATVEESIYNLACKANTNAATAYVFAYGQKVLVSGTTLTGWSKKYTGTSSGFNVVGGTIPLMIVYDENYYVIGDPIVSQPAYIPAKIGNLSVALFATDATDTNNYKCLPNTYLHAEAYDYEPRAIYDYVMGLHQEVDYYYPPVPAQAAGLFVNGVEVENAALFPDNPTYTLGHKTIHWMEEEYGKLPWPAGVTQHDTPVDPVNDKTMAFYFVVGFQCATGPVTSLVSAPGSAIKLYTYGTNDTAATGDLMIDAALDLSVTEAGVSGFQVAKQGKGGQLLAGPVVERIKAGSGIIISQPAGCPVGQGTVTISADDGSMRGHFNEIALENAKQEKIGLFPYVSLLGWGESSNIPSAFTTMMRVPSNLDSEKDYKLNLRMVMFGATGYTGALHRAAGVQLEYNILPDFYTPQDKKHLSLKTGLLIPDNPRQISVPLGHYEGGSWTYVAYDPFVATTDANMLSDPVDWDVCIPFSELPIPTTSEFSTKTPELKPGYLVALRISRIATPDTQTYATYTGPLGFLSMEWSLEEA